MFEAKEVKIFSIFVKLFEFLKATAGIQDYCHRLRQRFWIPTVANSDYFKFPAEAYSGKFVELYIFIFCCENTRKQYYNPRNNQHLTVAYRAFWKPARILKCLLWIRAVAYRGKSRATAQIHI